VSAYRRGEGPSERFLDRLAGRPSISIREKTAAASDESLADNLPANAADCVKAVHAPDNGERRALRQGAHLAGSRSVPGATTAAAAARAPSLVIPAASRSKESLNQHPDSHEFRARLSRRRDEENLTT